MVKQKTSRFKGKVKDNAEKTKSGANFGYLRLPEGVSFYNPEPGGRSYLDIMPYVVTDPNHPDRDDKHGVAVVGEWWYKRPFKIHRNIGAEKQAVVCLTSIGKKCPICEYRAQMMKEGKGKDETDELKPSNRNLYAVMVLKDKKLDGKICVFDISHACFQKKLTAELEENEEYEVFPDLEQGYTIRVRWESKTFGNSKPFADASRIDFEERDAYDESIIKEVPSLDKLLNIMDYKKLERLFLEIEDDDDTPAPEPEEEDTPPARTRRPRPAPEPDEEDEPEPPAPEPVRTGRRKKPEPEPEPEDDDDDVCVACQGSGKNSKGGQCRICGGTGEKKTDPEPEPEPPKRERQRKPKADDNNPCPHGHKWAVDWDKMKECSECKKWDDCADAHDAMEA